MEPLGTYRDWHAPSDVRVGDTVRVTDTYDDGDVRTKTFVVKSIGGDTVSGERLYAYQSGTSHYYTRTWEIIKRGEIPEPQNIGAVVRFERKHGQSAVTLMRVPPAQRDGLYKGREWLVVAVNDDPRSGIVYWTWESVNDESERETYEVLSEGVAL
jgi:hypothetical protein